MTTKVLRLIISFGLIAGFSNGAIGACNEELQDKYNSLAFKAETYPTLYLGEIMALNDYLDMGGTMLTNEEIQLQKDAQKASLSKVRTELKLLRREHRCEAKDPALVYYANHSKCAFKLAKRNKELRGLAASLFSNMQLFRGYEHMMNFMANRDESMRTVLLNLVATLRSFTESKAEEMKTEVLEILKPCMEESEE